MARLYSIDTDGNPARIESNLSKARVANLAFVTADSGEIYSANLATETFTKLTDVSGANWRGITRDPVSGHLYACSRLTPGGAIYRGLYDGGDPFAAGSYSWGVLVSGEPDAYGVTVSRVTDKLIWTRRGEGSQALRQSDLDGSNVETLATPPILDEDSGLFMGYVVANDAAGLLYTAEGAGPGASGGGALSMSLNGTGPELVLGGTNIVGVAVGGDFIYATSFTQNEVYRRPRDLSGPATTILSGLNDPNQIVASAVTGTLYLTNRGTNEIWEIDTDGTILRKITLSGIRGITLAF